MIKQYTPYFIYLILSITVVLFSQYMHSVGLFIVTFYHYIDTNIDIFFNHSASGLALRQVVALVLCPLLITGIPALIYRLIKGSPMPYFIEATWLFWIVIVLSKVLVK